METRKETYKDGITIKDLKIGDTIYLSKNISGYKIIIDCIFITFSKIRLKGKIKKVDSKWVICKGKNQWNKHISEDMAIVLERRQEYDKNNQRRKKS